jgi:Exostosin family
MRKICFVCLAHESFDIAAIFETALAELKVDIEIIRLPHFFLSALTNDRFYSLKKLLKQKSSDAFVIFFPDTAELFMKEADFTVVFSAYRSWFSQNRMRVIPHLWTPVRLPENVDDLTWTEKPPMQIGFMGRSHETSRLANFILKFPNWIKEWLLQGNYLRYPYLIAQLNELGISTQFINAFPRAETIRILRTKSRNHDIGVDLEIIEERQDFGGTEQERKKNYKHHLKKNTYIVCPRGSENYSFRIYEALNFGRIPVIVDTDVVLPKEINWDRLSIIVPYKSLHGLYDAIVQDYESRSGDDFLARQQEAFSTMTELRSMRWVKDLASELSNLAGKLQNE